MKPKFLSSCKNVLCIQNRSRSKWAEFTQILFIFKWQFFILIFFY